jgi:uncharacterized protein (DUF305 family)
MYRRIAAVFLTITCSALGPVEAQEIADHAPLPALCRAGAMAGMDMGKSEADSTMAADAAHAALSAGMDQMQVDMMAGMQAPDIDVAFVCGMIPHHQGAIAMARAELKFGKDPANRRLAEGIIAAQEKEIAGMLDWLEKHGK